MPDIDPELSVVVPMYDEEEVLPIFFERMHPLLDGLGITYELLAVDDGSRDRTAALLLEAAKDWKELRVVRLLRNSGHQAAQSAGFRRARGEYVVTIDADLQDPPEVIPQMVEKWQAGYDVVYGVRTRREGETAFKRATAAVWAMQTRATIIASGARCARSSSAIAGSDGSGMIGGSASSVSTPRPARPKCQVAKVAAARPSRAAGTRGPSQWPATVTARTPDARARA